MIVKPSDSWKLIWTNRDGGGDLVDGNVRKTNVLGSRDNCNVDRRVERLVSPGAGAGVDILESNVCLRREYLLMNPTTQKPIMTVVQPIGVWP